VPTFQELYDKADLVLILQVTEVAETDAKVTQYPDPNFYQGYRATCDVLSVLKGKLEEKNVSINFFQHPEGMIGYNGAIPAPFSLDKRVRYLAYLQRKADGQLVAVTGEYDAGLSIKLMVDYQDNKYLQLPAHGKTTDKQPAPAKPAAPAPK
jgi:hypothetical protein